MNIKHRLNQLAATFPHGTADDQIFHDALKEIERLELIVAAAHTLMTVNADDPETHLEALLSAGDALRKALGLPPAPT
jgi:hypothetical protein